jgi:hypothetical protein
VPGFPDTSDTTLHPANIELIHQLSRSSADRIAHATDGSEDEDLVSKTSEPDDAGLPELPIIPLKRRHKQPPASDDILDQIMYSDNDTDTASVILVDSDSEKQTHPAQVRFSASPADKPSTYRDVAARSTSLQKPMRQLSIQQATRPRTPTPPPPAARTTTPPPPQTADRDLLAKLLATMTTLNQTVESLKAEVAEGRAANASLQASVHALQTAAATRSRAPTVVTAATASRSKPPITIPTASRAASPPKSTPAANANADGLSRVTAARPAQPTAETARPPPRSTITADVGHTRPTPDTVTQTVQAPAAAEEAVASATAELKQEAQGLQKSLAVRDQLSYLVSYCRSNDYIMPVRSASAAAGCRADIATVLPPCLSHTLYPYNTTEYRRLTPQRRRAGIYTPPHA